jgi:Na+-translocating ferredoxin:NAD+ oxidoreductase subunit G
MRLIPVAMVMQVAATATTGVYAAEYLTVPAAQKALFPAADHFVAAPLVLTDMQRDQIKRLSGVRQRNAKQLVWRAEQQGVLLGWFIVDEVVGKHEFITYAAALSPQGAVLGIDVLVYRETYGSQIRGEVWRKQFAGKQLQNPLVLGKDITNISGATLSCKNVSTGVRRLLALQQVALHP